MGTFDTLAAAVAAATSTAEAAATDAQTAQTGAETAQTGAQTAESNAAASATAAAVSATAAATSATQAEAAKTDAEAAATGAYAAVAQAIQDGCASAGGGGGGGGAVSLLSVHQGRRATLDGELELQWAGVTNYEVAPSLADSAPRAAVNPTVTIPAGGFAIIKIPRKGWVQRVSRYDSTPDDDITLSGTFMGQALTLTDNDFDVFTAAAGVIGTNYFRFVEARPLILKWDTPGTGVLSLKLDWYDGSAQSATLTSDYTIEIYG